MFIRIKYNMCYPRPPNQSSSTVLPPSPCIHSIHNTLLRAPPFGLSFLNFDLQLGFCVPRRNKLTSVHLPQPRAT